MNITELFLESFGKFNKKQIKLKNGLNIIYGKNEAGKTTVHKFMEGMFYGFFNPFTKTKRYTDDYSKYFPLNCNSYNGVLKYKYKDTVYVIERNFIKGNDEVKVYDEIDGQDISYLFNYDKCTKLIQPYSAHIGLNSTVFNNTISIGQLKSKTDETLVKEVKDSLINFGGSLVHDISVKNVIDDITKSIDEIGNENREKTSIYGKLTSEIKELNIEIAKAKTINREKKEYEFKLKELNDEFVNLNDEKINLEKALTNLEKNKILSQYEQANNIKKQLDELKKMFKELVKYKDININDLEPFNRLQQQFQMIKEKTHLIKNSKINLTSEFKNINSDIDINDTLRKAKNLQNEKSNKEKVLYFNRLIILLSAVMGTCFLFLSFKNEFNILNMSLSFITSLLLIYFIINERKIRRNIRKLLKNIKKYEVIISENDNNNVKIKEYLKQRAEEFDLELNKLNNEYYIIQNNIKSVLSRNKVNDKEDFLKAINYNKKYKSVISEIALKERVLDEILYNISFEELEDKVKILNQSQIHCNEVDIEEIKERYNNITLLISENEKEISALSERINYLNNECRSIVEIEEEIFEKCSIKKSYDDELQSLNLVVDTLNEISVGIHKEFAPKLNKKVSDIIKKVTNDKYNTVKVSEDLNIKVSHKDLNKLIDIKNLSSGTIDQFYFSVRLGIIDIIKENNELPLLLDDCFIQYDDNRLYNILHYLHELSKDKQILIFTCQERERIMLDKMKLVYNYIEL